LPEPTTAPPARLQGVATPPPEALLDSRRCGHCGCTIPKPRPGQKACSSRCRWALWKTKRTQAQAGRDREIRELLEAALRKLGGLILLLVIFGAGASYDSAAHAWPREATPRHLVHLLPYRPPLADQLFESRLLFDSIMTRYPQCHGVVPGLRKRADSRSVEAALTELESQSGEYPERRTQLAALRYYLRDLLWECQAGWAQLTGGVTNYKALLDHVERWRRRYEAVTLVTFNYDTLLEDALPAAAKPILDINDYVARTPTYVTLKLHGSVNWVRPIEQSLPDHMLDVAAREWICANISKVTYDPRVRVLQSPQVRLPEASKPGTFPAIAVPLQRKANFECPPTHVRWLEQRIPETTKVLIIGWRAQDPALLELMANMIDKPGLQGLIAAGKEQDAKVIRQTLLQHRVAAGSFGLAAGGFSDLVTGSLLDEFLSA
jgi:hypothetical protein